MSGKNEFAEALKAPFDDDDLVYLVDKGSITEGEDGGFIAGEVPEVHIDAAYERLDQVFGMDGWEMFVDPLLKDGETAGFRCQIRAYFPTRTVTKTGVGVSASGDVPEALRKAFLSSARLFGLGRYLSKLEEQWVPVDKDGNPNFDLDEIPAQEAGAANLAASDRTSEEQLMEDIPIGVTEPQGVEDPIPFPDSQARSERQKNVSEPGQRRKRNLPSPQRTPGYKSNA